MVRVIYYVCFTLFPAHITLFLMVKHETLMDKCASEWCIQKCDELYFSWQLCSIISLISCLECCETRQSIIFCMLWRKQHAHYNLYPVWKYQHLMCSSLYLFTLKIRKEIQLYSHTWGTFCDQVKLLCKSPSASENSVKSIVNSVLPAFTVCI